MAGPAFVVMVNAITGDVDANSADNGSVRLYQGFWKAETRKEFLKLYGYTTGIYENAYSCEDLMQVMKVYNEDTTPEDLKALTEAYTAEDVKERRKNSERLSLKMNGKRDTGGNKSADWKFCGIKTCLEEMSLMK